tara:strand:- start:3937 stop:4275 length:339 start_codon:yes stop_codon:yes gene_type:complete
MKTNKNQIIENEYKVLSALEKEPSTTQRNLAGELNFSIGKVNYVIKNLYSRGLIKLGNFAGSENKPGYMYILTPKGAKEKLIITQRFLEEKIEEYEQIQLQITELKEKLEKH